MNTLPTADLSPYAGRWVALVHGRIAGVGATADEARRAAQHARPKEEPQVIRVPPPEYAHISIPDWPWHEVLRLAQNRRTHLWLVGGAVRDLLLGYDIHDWDFATETHREALEMARAVADALHGGYYALDFERGIGRAVVTAPDGQRMELDFAALRGGRLESDLTTRDFTVNSLAVTADGTLIDFTGGLEDLRRRTLRATSEQTFAEDPLRLLRAVRLEAVFGLTIEPHTLAWLRRDADLLALPSVERVSSELLRMLDLRGAVNPISRLDELGLMRHVLPELPPLKNVPQSPPHRFDVWKHTLLTLDAMEMVLAAAVGEEATPTLVDAPSTVWGSIGDALAPLAARLRAHLEAEVGGGHNRALLLKMAALLHDIGKPATISQDDAGRIHFYKHESVGARMAARRLRRLHMSSDATHLVKRIILHHLRPAFLAQGDRIRPRAIYRYFRATGDAGVEISLLRLADYLATWGPGSPTALWERELDTARTLLTHYFAHRDETISPPPLVTGRDLIDELGIPQGPEIGRLLEILREAQAVGEIHTRAEGLALAQREHRERQR